MKIKNSYLYKLIVEQEEMPGRKIVFIILHLLSFIYVGIIKLRLFLYKIGVFKSYRLNVPVVNMGNISVGGSGKTVFTYTIGNLIKQEFDKKPAVLLRGYGAKIRNSSNRKKEEVDEEALLKRNLEGIPVLVGKNRVKNSEEAVEKFKSDCIILDDGFQYLKLKKDLNIVLIKSHTILKKKFPLPRGLLREPFSHLDRADVLVVTDIDRISKNKIKLIQTYLCNFCPTVPILFTYYLPKGIYNVVEGKKVKFEDLKNVNFISVSGIGDPGSFRNSLKKKKVKIEDEIIYPDHFDYNSDNIKKIIRHCKELKLHNVVTTQKDICKITPFLDKFIEQNINLFVLKIKLVFVNKEHRRKLREKLHNLFIS